MMSRKLSLLTSVVMVLVLAGGASALEMLVVPQGTTHTVTGKEEYSSFEVAGTLIVEEGGELTVGLGAEKSVIDGLEATVIVNGGVINLNSRLDVGNDSNATIIMNGGLFRIGNADSIDDAGDIKMPDDDGGHQRIILNGGLLWAHRCQMKFAVTDDAKIIVAGGEMRIDTLGVGEDPGEPESYDPDDWLAAGSLLLAEDKGYTELVVSPNTPAADYYKISAIAKPLETLVVPQGATHTVTGKERYSSFEVAGTLIVEKGGELTAGLGTDKPRSTIDGPEAKLIVNGGTIKLNSRINVGYADNATLIMNGGLFRVGNADSSDDLGDIKLPDSSGGTQRIILNGGLLWAHRCQLKFGVTDDAKIIVAGGEMRLDTMGDNDPEESYDPNDWLAAGGLLLAEDKGYTELVVSPNTPTKNHYSIRAIGAKAIAGSGPKQVKDIFSGDKPGISWDGSVWYLDSDPQRLFVNSDGDLEWTPKGREQFVTSIPEQRLSQVGDVVEKSYMFMSDGDHDCEDCLKCPDSCFDDDITCLAGTSDIRVGLFESVERGPDHDGFRGFKGYNFRFGPNMMAGPTRWVDCTGEVHKTGMFGKKPVNRDDLMSKNAGLMGRIPGFELEPGKFSFFRVRLERIAVGSILLSIKLNGRTIEYIDNSADDQPQKIDVFAVSMRNKRPYTRLVLRAL